MKLPKLPPLRKSNTGKRAPQTAAMPVGPKLSKAAKSKLAKAHGFQLIKDGWGDVGDGRWTPVVDRRDKTRTVVGTCWKCAELKRAVKLRPRRLSTGEDVWICDECW